MSFVALIVPLGGGPGIDNSLPGVPVYPSNELPGAPVYPGQGLPSGGRPTHPIAGYPVIVPAPVGPVRPPPGTAEGKVPYIVWFGPGHPPQVVWVMPPAPGQGLPTPPLYPSQGLPGEQPDIDNTLPGGPPMRPDNTLPPTATPKR
jgi:hypothetical protein